MEEMIMNVNTLPEPLYRRFRSDRIRVHEENGVVMLTPVKDLPKKTPKPGGWEGKIWMADDFDAPLDDFREYME